MQDFTWTMAIAAGCRFTLTMNECADGSPWVNQLALDAKGEVVGYDEVIAAIRTAHGSTDEEAEAWANSALQERLDFERAKPEQIADIHALRGEAPKIENPFENPILRQDYSTACELRRLAVHLFNGSVAPDMAALMRSDQRHRQLALAMLSHYAEHGESDQVFMRVCGELANG